MAMGNEGVDASVSALVVVDMQNYYLRDDSPYHRYFYDTPAGVP